MPCPDVPTKRRVVGILGHGDPWIRDTPDNAKITLDDLSEELRRSRPSRTNDAHITEFPMYPHELENLIEGFIETVYGTHGPSDDPPITTDELDALQRGIVSRWNNKKVRRSSAAPAPASDALAIRGNDSAQGLQAQMAQFCQQMQLMMQQGQQLPGSLVHAPRNASELNTLRRGRTVNVGTTAAAAAAGVGGPNIEEAGEDEEPTVRQSGRTGVPPKRPDDDDGDNADGDDADDGDKADAADADDDLATLEAAMMAAPCTATAKAKGKAKATAKGKAKAKAKAGAACATLPLTKPAVLKRPAAATVKHEKPKLPHWTFEKSRHQIMCRTGLIGKGQNSAIKFDVVGGQKTAILMADAWVVKKKKELKLK